MRTSVIHHASRSTACLLLALPAAWADTHQRAGDALRYLMPAGIVAFELARDDTEGLLQFGAAWAATMAGTSVLKRSTHVERPDRSNDESFPSGHASHAFAAATYVHRRHGLEHAWPWYAAASYVGWTRVHAERHRWGDVLGSAALAGACSWLIVTPKAAADLAIVPSVGRGFAAVTVQARW